MAVIAIVSMAAIMILVSLDTFARYVLNRPQTWASEVTTFYLMATASYFMIGPTLRHGDHININLFRGIMPKWLLNLSDMVWSALVALVFLWIAYASVENISGAFAGNDFIPGYFNWPMWLSHLPILLGAASVVLSLLLNIVLIATGAENPYAQTTGDFQE